MSKSEPDTLSGGSRKDFPNTSWSLVAGIQDASEETRQQALERLCQRYWKPVYFYIRRAWSKTSEDSKDLTQAFFLQILQGDSLRRYKPERGGFRTYIKVLLRGFAADQHDALNALKRGGGVKTLALDGSPAPLKEFVADPQAADPEKVFDRAWKAEILERALERARMWFASVNRSAQFRAFEEYDLQDSGERPTYAAVAQKLGVTESDVRNHLFSVRERLRVEIRSELSQTVSDLRELDGEFSDLFEK